MVTARRPDSAAPVEGARKITSDSELREIAAAGAGFIIDPANRWWHGADCPRVAAMTAGQPKWYAGTPAARESFLELRLTRHATAQPVRACPSCDESAAAPHAPCPPVSRATGSAAAGPQLRDPHVRRVNSGFEVWADEYVPNGPGATSSARRLRQLIASEIRALPVPAGRVLHAGYGGRRWRGTDVENLLFNNIDQGLALFRKPGGLGIRFEDLGLAVRPAPDGTARHSYYRYRLTEPGAPFAAIRPGHLICRVPEAAVPGGSGRLAARIWLAVRRARPLPGTSVPAEHGSFLLRVIVHQLEPAESLKAVIDGATAAMQRDDPGQVNQAVIRLAALLDADAGELLALATMADAPLGTRSRPGPASRQSLFTLDGPARVRVTPDDDRCIAAAVITAGKAGPARLSVEVYSAMHLPISTCQPPQAESPSQTLLISGT
jgi:hypothetical protein